MAHVASRKQAPVSATSNGEEVLPYRIGADKNKMLAPQTQRSASLYERRGRLLSSLRQSFTLPPVSQSILTVLPSEEYERYLEAPELLHRLGGRRHLATVWLTQGAQASVYLMDDATTGKPLAVKITSLVDPENVRLAVKEYTILQSLDHPGIVKPLAFWVDQRLNRALLFLPFDGNQTLADVGPLTEVQVRCIGVQLFKSLSYLHQHDIIHRDIKPANVLFNSNRTKLIDFQTAVRLQSAQWLMSTAGTREFTAPEIWSQNIYSAKVDVWSGAAVLLVLLGCKRTDALTSVSRECTDWFTRALASNPEERFTAEEALRHSWMA